MNQLLTWPAFDHLWSDLRYALRGMRRAPGFYATTILMLALGIGVNAAIFSVFSHVLLAPLEFPDSDELYVLSSHAASLGDARRASSGPDFRDYRDQNAVFTAVTAAIPHFSEVWMADGEPRVVNCAAPTEQFLQVMGVKPILGRFFSPEEFRQLQNTGLVISWKFWHNQLGGDPHVIGRTVRLEDSAAQIIGVMPPMNDIYSDVDVWTALATEPSWPFMNWRANKFLDVIGRLKPGISRGMAEQQLTSILRRGEGEPRDVQVQLTPLRDFIVGPVRNQLTIIMAAVGLVLLVTCVNAAALLLARAVKRTPELAVRLGLGASSSRIRQQMLVEGALLSATAGVCGIALAAAAVGLVRRVPGISLPRIDGLHLNAASLVASVAVVALTSVVFALLPARAAAGLNLSSTLHTGRTQTGRAQRRPFSMLVIAEVACAVVLTVCAGLLVRSFVRLQRVDLGFEPVRVLTAYLRTNYYAREGLPFWQNVLEQTSSLPGVTSTAVSDCMPAVRVFSSNLLFNDRPNDPNHLPSAQACWISADYFKTLGASVLRGRVFSARDNEAAPPVVIINAAAAQRFFPNEDPIGKRIAVNYLALGSRMVGPARMREIVGIVSNLRQRAAELPAEPAVYVPYTQDESYHVLASMNLFVRSAGSNPGALGGSVRARIQSLYPNQPVERLAVMPAIVSRTLARRTYSVGLITAFASLALLLCAMGIYGVVSYITLHRTREFGIRMALGATRRNVLCNVLYRSIVLIAIGTAAGIMLALAATRALSQLLFETTPLDPAIFAGTVLLLGLIGVLASLVPGIRAANLDPKAALSAE